MSSPYEHDENELFAAAFASRRLTLADNVLREKVLAQTAGVIRSRRRLKRVGIAASLVGCYLAGVLTMSLARNLDSSFDDTASNQLVAKTPSVASENFGKTPDQIADEAAQAAAAKLSRYELLRRAGDRYADEGDLAAAIQSYKNALRVATPEERTVSVHDDSWLLMALKNDHNPGDSI
jgi:hypothetical protein